MIALPWEGDWPISQLFAERPAYYAQYGLLGHNGLDIACPEGTAVRALLSSTVVEVEYDGRGYGNYVKLRHEHGTELLYAHLVARGLPEPGTVVDAGQPVALSGATGRVTGPHLHLGIRPDWRYRGGGYLGYVDPLLYLAEIA